MAIQDLMKFAKKVKLIIVSVEDDSSGRTVQKILHLAQEINAVSSTVVGETALPMKMKDDKVYIAGEDNIKALMEGCTEAEDGRSIIYEGDMHLDVSKPSGRTINGVYQITKPSKIWISKTKFNKLGNTSRQAQAQNFNSVVAQMFGGGKVYDPTVPLPKIEPPTENGKSEDEKGEPKVVRNKGEKTT